MKKIVLSILSISLLFSSPTYTVTSDAVKLDSKIIAMLDGRLIDADIIMMIRGYQHEIRKLLLTKSYTFNGTQNSIHDIVQHVTNNTLSPEDQKAVEAILVSAKKQFIKLSERYRGIARNSKEVMGQLVKESCRKRDRADSLLMIWADTKQENEDELFHDHVRSLEVYESFSVHLYDFLNDLQKSCPKAVGLYEERQKKFNLAKDAIELISFTSEAEKSSFLSFIRRKLDSLSVNQITQAKMKELYRSEFKK